MTIYAAYDQIASLLATLEPAKLASPKASDELQKRFEFLIELSNAGKLSKAEKDELDHYVVLERLVRLAKIRSGNR